MDTCMILIIFWSFIVVLLNDTMGLTLRTTFYIYIAGAIILVCAWLLINQ